MNIQWNAGEYANTFAFVPAYGEDVMNLLTVPTGARVMDLGCGNGTLTELLKTRGYNVFGVDDSEDMLKKARETHPDISFVRGNATTYTCEEPVDAIFSNAVFHWINAEKQDDLIKHLAQNLRTGGEAVFEFGGYKCADAVHSTLRTLFEAKGLNYVFEFFFPTIGQYAPMLEKHGLQVEYAILFDRPTPQKSENGLIDWINMFVTKPFEGMDPVTKQEILTTAEEELRPVLYHDSIWFIDYVRIRMRVRKQ